ncbi:hypothetical protein [Vibrio splendidus]|uniref:hypothetical protein n=1 Tax=Vibrio splendidus TaxID=29497 RepID=UPI000315DDB9|nr:hypothetical protein [Vibrio splendidus]OED82952.1 hypothetical protein A144_17340 [Vibrio splendidus ZF-90]OEF18351.1 hypothetical protein A145_20490 [Vibrio splendidus 5S-101]PMO90375.1 hypothetical protein BCS97_23030 [Vibrio splendidus]PMP27989.1 hypothetical protein BCS88_21335 [Vibrio splendidus]PMP28193.1 hypothetical protein BCS89_08715 [Vibrio splendidus]
MNFDINALKHHQLVEDGQLEGCYIHQPVQGSLPDDKAVLVERQALESLGYKVVQVKAKGGTTTFAEAMLELAKKTGHQTKD